jgi:hypothetical protein
MAIQDIILRSSTHSPLTTKGSELSYTELDGNFIEIYDAITSLNDVSGIAPFNIGTTYTGTEYVSYNGNVYVHISATSTTGVLPDTDPTKWQLTSTGALAHQQNKDSYLAYGSGNEVSATDLADIINNQVVNVTYANFVTAMNGGLLKVNRLYCITNTNALLDTGAYVNSQIKLYIRTLSNSKYSNKGHISIVAPNYNTYLPYDYTYPYLVGDKVVYGLYVYECTNATTNGDSPNNDTANWTIKSYLSFPSYYTIKYYDVDFFLFGGQIFIVKVYDGNNNTFGYNDFLNASIVVSNVCYNNDVDTTSSFKSFGLSVGADSNKLLNSSGINTKGGYGSFNNNYLNRSVISCDEFINGNVQGNNLSNVNINFIGGNYDNSFSNAKISFYNPTGINVHTSSNILGGYLNEQGGNIYASLDVSGLGGVVDLDSILGSADIYGEFRFDCASETIEQIIKANYFCPIVLRPNTSHGEIIIKIYSLGSATDDNFISTDYSGNITLSYDNNDYCVIERITIGGANYWNVTKIVKVV